MYIHNFDPIAFNIGPIAIRWYSLAYIFGIILSYRYILLLNTKFSFNITDKKDIEEVTFNAILGIILGGRLGYILFYNLSYYIHHPLEIIFIWQGGMSFHGGLVGLTLSVLYHAKKTNKSFLKYMDLIACSTPIGLFLGRIANFINGELYGKITNSNWGVIFPHAGNLPRHPSQLYEAGCEGIIAFVLMYLAIKQQFFRNRPGSLAGLFMVIYGLSRIAIEFFRLPDSQIGYFFDIITLGQILSLPMLLLGGYLIFYNHKENHRA